MRMRKKKNLESRLRLVSENLIIIDRDDRNFKNAEIGAEYIDFGKIFGNDNKVYLEIGCGKGQFAIESAIKNPHINFIAVDKVANVIVSGCEVAKEKGISNLVFMKCSAEYLTGYIKEGSIDRIYLNFSCPFPKKKYANHRLTAKPFLEIYRKIMARNSEIHMKTDNRGFFEFSIEQLSDFGFTLKNISLDLHSSCFEGNIITEYERKFSDAGFPIYRLEAYLK